MHDRRDQIIPLNIFYGSDRAVLFKMSCQQYVGNDILCNCLNQWQILECQIENTWSGAIRSSKVEPWRFPFVLSSCAQGLVGLWMFWTPVSLPLLPLCIHPGWGEIWRPSNHLGPLSLPDSPVLSHILSTHYDSFSYNLDNYKSSGLQKCLPSWDFYGFICMSLNFFGPDKGQILKLFPDGERTWQRKVLDWWARTLSGVPAATLVHRGYCGPRMEWFLYPSMKGYLLRSYCVPDFFLFVWIYSTVSIKHFVWSMFVMQSAFWRTAWTHHDELIFGKDVSCRADVMIYFSVLSAWPFVPQALTCLAQRYEKLICNWGSMGIVSLLVWVGDFLRATSLPVLKFIFFLW